jgi:type VI secretion system secreted protein Hcp
MITNQIKMKMVAVLLIVGAVILIALNAGGGSLEPNAPPGPTMHTLEDIYKVVSAGVEPPPQTFGVDLFYLKIAGIPGESTDDMHKDQVELFSYRHGMTGPTGVVMEPVEPGFDLFTVVKTLDKASPKLYLALCTGEKIPYIELEICDPNRPSYYVMEYKLSDCIVSSVKTQGGPSPLWKGDEVYAWATLPLEEVSFNYGKIEWTYTTPDGNTVYAGWDVDANTPIDPCGVLPPP